MYISLNWIKDFVNLDGIDSQTLTKRFLLSTAEIEDVITKGSDIKNVVLGKIESVVNHPNSDHLHILKVNNGTESVQVVCGAPNVREGMITAFAQLGGMVCGHKINKARIAGVESFGMCCSEAELGIGSDDNGIMDIVTDFPLGTDLKEVYPIDDTILEIDNKSLTNRPDLWGHYGLAREFSAIFNRELKPLDVEDLSAFDNLPKLDIQVEDKNCFRYSGISVKNVFSHKSDMKTKIRLAYCGMRDINLLADMTNYLMLELGQPMHAFDNELVKGIKVKSAKKDTKILTLEDEEHVVPENSVLICNENSEPVAIAGIKGGKLSGISDKTTSVLFESACFDCASIRKTGTAIGLKTDASQRYEKSLDPEMTTLALARLVHLLKQQCPQICVTSSLTDVYTKKYPTIDIKIDLEFIQKRIGVEINKNQVLNILKGLGFGVTEQNNLFDVTVPSYRATKDISIKEDLIEEIARMYGYDNIQPQSLKFEIETSNRDLSEYNTKYLLATKYGLSEVHSHLWNFEDFNSSVGIKSPSYVSLVDSSNSGQAGIRSAITPTLLKFFSENKNNFDKIGMFEIGRVCSGLEQDKHAVETRKLAILYAENKGDEKNVYFNLKKYLCDICQVVFKTKFELSNEPTNQIFNQENSVCIYTDGKKTGEFGLVSPSIISKIDKKWTVGVMEIDFDALSQSQKVERKIQKISKYQSVSLDFTFKVPAETTYKDFQNILDNFKARLNMSYSLKDIFKKPGQSDAWTFNFVISSNDRTLTSEDIEKFSTRLLNAMKENNIELKS